MSNSNGDLNAYFLTFIYNSGGPPTLTFDFKESFFFF